MMNWAVVVSGFYGKLLDQEDSTRPLMEVAAKRTDDQLYLPYIKFLQGEITRDELEKNPIFYNEDYLAPSCIRGFFALIDKRPETARAHFQWVIDNGAPNAMEVGIAQTELERLDAEDK